MRGLGDIKMASGVEGRSREVIPSAQLLDGDVEAIGNGDECVSGTRAIEGCSDGCADRSHGDDDGVDSAEVRGRVQLIDFRDLGSRDVERARDIGEGLICGEGVIAPVAALVFGDLRDAVRNRSLVPAGRFRLKVSSGGVAPRSRLGLSAAISCGGAPMRSATRGRPTL
jgi:hypothetical protein